jgi:glucokinase
MEAYAGRAAMEAKARRELADGEKTDLFELMKKHGKDRLTSSVWDRALRHDDPLAVRLIDEAVKAIATAVASAVNLLDIEAVVIGGGLGVRLGEPYVERIRERMGRHLFLDDRPPAVELAALGDFGGAIGASLLFEE